MLDVEEADDPAAANVLESMEMVEDCLRLALSRKLAELVLGNGGRALMDTTESV